MTDEICQAISFANGYFALADGLVSDLENHLAEDVVLDWFGQTIEGHANVAAFMNHQKIDSKHMFTEINPVSTIGYRKNPSQRRKYHSLGSSHENGNIIKLKSTELQGNVGYKRKYYSDIMPAAEASSSQGSSPGGIQDMEVEFCALKKASPRSHLDLIEECDINFDKLQLGPADSPDSTMVTSKRPRIGASPALGDITMFADFGKCLQQSTGIKLTNTSEIERKVAILNEKGNKTMKDACVKTEIGQGDGPTPVETNSIKYVETCGVIEFSKFVNTKQIRKEIRKRYCRLQIAYSIKDENYNSVDSKLQDNELETDKSMEMDGNTEVVTVGQSKLMSLGELRELSGKLVPNTNEFHDYEDDEDDCGTKNKFLECLELEIKDKDGNINNQVTPKYVRHQLIFDNSLNSSMGSDCRGFLFNYVIHMIIYESNTKCRLNLSQEFEDEDSSDEDK